MGYHLYELDRERRVVRRMWTAVAVVFILAPIPLLVLSPDKGADKWVFISFACGFIALAGIVAQLLSPSRVRTITEPFGIGVLLRLHRWGGVVVLVLVIAHICFMVIPHDYYMPYLLPFGEKAEASFPLPRDSWKAWAGVAAAMALLLIVLTSFFRRRLRLGYEVWRILHIVLGTVALAGAALHIMLISWYTDSLMLRWYVVAVVVTGVLALGALRVFRPYVASGSPWVVSGIVPELGDSTTLQLTALGHDGLEFRPGQFAWIRTKGSAYSITEHPFSIASSAMRPQEVSFTIKRLGDFTKRVGEISPGTRVVVDGPHGSWEPALPEAGFVLIVAGIGVTPAMSFLRTFDDIRDGRPVQMLYGARDWDNATFREELAELQQRLDLDLRYVLAEGHPGWNGEVGRIDLQLLMRVLPDDARMRNFLICGPPPMIDGTMAALRRLGIPDELVYADRFDSA